MNKLMKLTAVALSASLLLFGCSSGIEKNTSGEETLTEKRSTDSTQPTAAEDPTGADSSSKPEEDTQESGEVIDLKNTIVDSSSLSFNDNVHINQIGYRDTDKKQVIINGKSSHFAVFEKESGKQIYIGHTTKGASDNASGDNLYYGDFSEVKNAGTYFIAVPGIGVTDSFVIGKGVFNSLRVGLLKSFYYQRCGLDLEKKFAGEWGHAACHIEKGKIYGEESTEIDGNGGWHDAGDYGKYIVPAATAVADLMMTWEFFPDSYGDAINIPESGNGISDILDETRYELEWMLKMQEGTTGGVYHKLTSKIFPSLATMPQDDYGELFYSPVSAAATGSFSAAMAMAARIYGTIDTKFADKCLKASEKAWVWLEKNQGAAGFKNPSDILTGEYGDNKDTDERYWAAAELYRTTGSEIYGEYIKSVYNKNGLDNFDFGWQSMTGFAGVAYLFNEKEKQDQAVSDYLKGILKNAAGKRLQKGSLSGYHITLSAGDYNWGSNMNLLNDARLMIIADKVDANDKYINTALNNFNYLLGSNTLNQCYVTGFGRKPVLDPHHRPSKGDDAELPVPGLVAGGPNSGLQDDYAKMKLKKLPPAKCYIDYSGSYSTNETAIYWNSPAVFVAAYFDR